MDQCRSCHAYVLRLKNDKTGKVAPIDPEPVEGGNIIINKDFTYSVVGKQEGQLRHLSHFVSCPHAVDWRRRKKSAPIGRSQAPEK